MSRSFNSSDMYELSHIHYQWLHQMGYLHETPLENLALVTSEIGEAVNAYRDHGTSSDEFATELADIVLRTMGLAHRYNIDLVDTINRKINHNYDVLLPNGNRGRTI